jgi:16S rRNA (guanine527-N7)-methyltransferase
MTSAAEFQSELDLVLPQNVPHRQQVITVCAQHLAKVVEVNQVMNLTRITTAKDGAVKHVLDSLLPWKLLQNAESIVDIGSGAGFPGIPLAAVFPEKKVVLVESIQKKARFLSETVGHLELPNVTVFSERAEDYLQRNQADVLVARAVAPLPKLLAMLGPALQKLNKMLLYKGPDIDQELQDSRMLLKQKRWQAGLLIRHELPDQSGTRCILELLRY